MNLLEGNDLRGQTRWKRGDLPAVLFWVFCAVVGHRRDTVCVVRHTSGRISFL